VSLSGAALALILIGVVVWAVGAPFGGVIILIGIILLVWALLAPHITGGPRA